MMSRVSLVFGIMFGVEFSVLTLAMAGHSGTWTRRALKLAANSDIALPEPLVPVVARFLRNTSLAALPATWLIAASLSELSSPAKVARSIPWVVATFPVLTTGFLFLLTCWPRWNNAGPRGMSHANPVPIRRVFTRTEWAVVVVGVMVAAASDAWGLRKVSASVLWWTVSAVGLAFGVVAWRLAASAIMNRPARAS